jgi:hypothetical protein
MIRMRAEKDWRRSCSLLRCRLHFEREGDWEVLGFFGWAAVEVDELA